MNKVFRLALIILTLIISSCNNSKDKLVEQQIKSIFEIDYKLEESPIGKEIIEGHVDFLSPLFKSKEKFHMVYELSIVNTFRQDLELKKIEVLSADSTRKILKTFDKDYLSANFNFLGKRNNKDVNIIFSAGQKGVVNLQISFDELNNIPKSTFHRLYFGLETRDGEIVDIPFELALIEIPQKTSTIIGLPFKKGKWFYTAESHKNSRFITQGKPTFPERFAIDWAYIESDGTFLRGNPNQNKNYPTYRKEILAVADGTIKEIKNEYPDNIPGQIDLRITRETIGGNYLVLDIGNNINVVYGHFVPNSFKVNVGDKVKKGQVIGLLGNSGNSDAPHLHMHLETDSPKVLGGQGIPYIFKEFKQIKSYSLEEMKFLFEGEKLDLSNPQNLTQLDALPIGNGVVQFK